MERKSINIISTIIVVLVILAGGYFCQRSISANKEQSIISNIIGFCDNKKIIVDGEELRIKINSIIKPTSKMKEKYGIEEVPGEKQAVFDVSTINRNGEIITNHRNPLIVSYELSGSEYIIDENVLFGNVYKKILIADYEDIYFKKTNSLFNGSFIINSLKTSNTLDKIKIINSKKDFIIEYDVVNDNDELYEFERKIDTNL